MQRPPQGYPPPGYGYGPPPPPAYYPPPPGAWTCPFCRYCGAPESINRVSTAGWVIFFLCLFSCVGTLFCWLPLIALTKDFTRCPSCRTVVGGGV